MMPNETAAGLPLAAERDETVLLLLQKNSELEQALRHKSEFLAGMSHELRTPLNAIIGFSEVLRDGLLGELTAEQRKFAGEIFASGRQLLALINDVIDLSRAETGTLTLDLEPVEVPALLANSLAIIAEQAAIRNIRLTMEVAENLGSFAADARKVKQLLHNLLANAVRHTPAGGQVTLLAGRVPRAEVGQSSGPWPGRTFPLADNEFAEFIKLNVTDSGSGIPAEVREHLFAPFRKLAGGGKREAAGLGLAMVKLIAELHGGTVAVASALGKGSSFTVWLPLRAPVEKSRRADETPPAGRGEPPAGARTALVLEDDYHSAELIRVQLAAEGFRVLHAASAEAALALALQQPVSLITLDILLPNMGGWEFLSRLKQMPDLRRIPVVIISSAADHGRGLELGAAAVMQKPVSRQELHATLADLGLFPPPPGRALKVLVVDDNPRTVELIAVRIVDLASTILRAYNGREAIAIALQQQPDLIVLDLMMPEMNGFEVAATLKRDPATARIPIIALTAKAVTAGDHARLDGLVASVMEKTDFNRDHFIAEMRRVTLLP